MTTNIEAEFRCQAIVPDSSTPLKDIIYRWSENNVERPALVVIPESEEDIIQAIQYAKENGLRLMPAGGGCGFSFPVTKNTLYLNLERFNHIKLDQKSGTVQMGGGVRAGSLHKNLAKEGYYTAIPNHNKVGMVGFVLGGGSVSCRERLERALRVHSLTRPRIHG